MAGDVIITRSTLGNYQPQNVQYSNLPAHVTQQLSAGLIQASAQIDDQARKNNLLTLHNTMKENLFRIEQENQGNPKGMSAAFDSWKEGYLGKLPEEDKTLMTSQFLTETQPALRRATSLLQNTQDNQTGTNALVAIGHAQEAMKKTVPMLFSNDPGAVYDAHKNMETQQTIIDSSLDLKKADGAFLFSPEQRASKGLSSDKILAQGAEEVWAARPLAEKIDIATKAMDQSKGAPVPADRGADFVKPYSPKQIADTQAKVSAPSEYDQAFKDAAAANGLDWKDLKLHAVVESGLDPKAMGKKTENGQAGGLMQLTEETAKALGVTDRMDPVQSINGAAKLMKQNMDAAGGNSRAADQLYYGGADRKKWGANTAQYADNLAAVRGQGAHETGTEFDFLDPKYKQQAFKAVMDAKDIQDMQFAAPAERMAIAARNGNPDVLAAARKIDEVLQKDPAAYVASAPDVVTAAQNAQTAKTPEAHAKYVQASLDMQRKLGVPEWQQKVLTETQAKDAVGAVQDSFVNRQDVHAQMIQMRQLYGENWPRVAQELQKAKMPASALVLAAMDKPLQIPYAKLLSTAVGEGEKTLFEAVPTADGKSPKPAIEKQLAVSLEQFRESTQRSNGGTQNISDFQDAATMLAAKLMQTENLTPEKAADKAANVLVNDYYHFAGTYRIPNQFSDGRVQSQAEIKLAELPDALYVGGNENDKKAYLTRVKQEGYWVNNPTDDGIMLKDAAGNYVRHQDGSFVNYPFAQLEGEADAKGKEGMTQQEMLRQMMMQTL